MVRLKIAHKEDAKQIAHDLSVLNIQGDYKSGYSK
jgi:hypothetical protein